MCPSTILIVPLIMAAMQGISMVLFDEMVVLVLLLMGCLVTLLVFVTNHKPVPRVSFLFIFKTLYFETLSSCRQEQKPSTP